MKHLRFCSERDLFGIPSIALGGECGSGGAQSALFIKYNRGAINQRFDLFGVAGGPAVRDLSLRFRSAAKFIALVPPEGKYDAFNVRYHF